MTLRHPPSGVGSGSWTTSTRSSSTASRPSCRSWSGPYAALAEEIGSDEDAVLERVAALREQKVIRQVSAIFDSRRLGYRGMLVAARTPVERQDDAADVFSSHPGVSHNYLREHELNLWFTLTVSPRSQLGLDRTVELLGELAEVDVIRPDARAALLQDRRRPRRQGRSRPGRQARQGAAGASKAPPPESLSDRDLDAIRALQRDLPAEAEPFGELAAQAGFDDGRAARLRPRVPRDRADAPLRRRARAPQRRVRAERHGRLAACPRSGSTSAARRWRPSAASRTATSGRPTRTGRTTSSR